MEKPTILLVEDDDAVRLLVRRILGRGDFELLEAENGFEALRRAEEHGREVDLLLSDVAMPGMSGAELAQRLRQQHPSLAVLFMSGYFDQETVRTPIREGREWFIEKPFTPDELADRVAAVLAARGTSPEDGS
ncbi:MAG TPA: response regulator [Longimicrobiales bacterium]|nr:response regulator [Longimicrobiales bacterium]